MAKNYVSVKELEEAMKFVTEDTTCPLHIAATIDQTIALLPDADVEEVRHGKWISLRGQSYLVHPMKYDSNGEPLLQHYVTYKCSCCGRVEAKQEPYCNCGAKMDCEEMTTQGHWIYWPGWSGNHDQRIDDAVCSVCGYNHETVRLDLSNGETSSSVHVPDKLSKQCPKCKSKMSIE